MPLYLPFRSGLGDAQNDTFKTEEHELTGPAIVVRTVTDLRHFCEANIKNRLPRLCPRVQLTVMREETKDALTRKTSAHQFAETVRRLVGMAQQL